MKSNVSPIYLIPGMTAGYPIFERLAPLLPNAIVAEFIPPKPDESLVGYAARMAEHFFPDSFIAGVSFGGIVALEISRLVHPKGCILISSIRHPRQLPPWFRAWRILGGRRSSTLLQMIGGSSALVPKSVRTASTIRATKLDGAGGHWHRWATSAVLDWQPVSDSVGCPLLQIHGATDTTFPIRYTNPDVSVPKAGHSLPVSHPTETANAIAAFTKTA